MRFPSAILLPVLAAFLAEPSSPADGARQSRLIDRVSWLTGCWRQESPNRIIEERWTPPLAGTMMGVGRTISDNVLVEHEFILLAERDGELAYQAHPSGQPVATFLSPHPTDSLVLFEDPGHDFPKRIGYRRVSADSLVAWVEGTLNGKDRRIEFSYRRVSCVES